MLPPTYKHSASSGNCYASAPSAFVYKWVLRNFSDEQSARQAMGSAVDYAIGIGLMGDLTDEEICNLATAEFDRLRKGEVTEERDCAARIALRFLSQLRPLGKPLSWQQETILEGAPFGLAYPIKTKTDLEYDEFGIDLKATLRCPSAMGDYQLQHKRQVALYSAVRGKPYCLLYASRANHFHYIQEAEERAELFAEMLETFRRIENLDRVCQTPADALALVPYCPEHFYDKAERVKAKRAWSATEVLDTFDDKPTILAAG
jgi:hypothetical protein